jgi:ATP-binding protein involved in chromosome partitioning
MIELVNATEASRKVAGIRASEGSPMAAPQVGPALLPGVNQIIAVGSGKGGVGKSTVAVNLAAALAQTGARTGLLDADIYGPSIPIMMGLDEQPAARKVGDRTLIQPLHRHGLKTMSLGFLLPPGAPPVIWRGPMVGSAVKQLLGDVEWGELDYLVVDLPPGTGDAQLTLSQVVPLTGAVIVMTSQDVALQIAHKALAMFQKLNVPVLGIVENMGAFVCPSCGTATPIFGRGTGEQAAAEMQVPFLGSVPLEPAIVEHGDAGTPTVIAAPASAGAAAFRQIAEAVVERVGGSPAEEQPGWLGKVREGLSN